MLTLHLIVCYLGLLAGAVVLVSLCRGRRQPTWDTILLLSSHGPSIRRLLPGSCPFLPASNA